MAGHAEQVGGLDDVGSAVAARVAAEPGGAARTRDAALDHPRGRPLGAYDASVVVPVNAQADLQTVVPLLKDLSRYAGPFRIETLLLVNNFPEETIPDGLATLEALGARVALIPNVRRDGVRVHLAARMEGVRNASSDIAILFDADCRVPHPTEIIDWYVRTLRDGPRVAYSHVEYYDMPGGLAGRTFIVTHHASRWFKRVVLRIPTTRGSNYGVIKDPILALYDDGLLMADMSVGPATKAAGGRVVYSGARQLTVLTSGRKLTFSWRKFVRYLGYATLYNIRVLPKSANSAAESRR